MSYYDNDPARDPNPCAACGAATYHDDDALCQDCQAEAAAEAEEVDDTSTPAAQREIGRELYAAGRSFDDCRTYWQQVGWDQAADEAGEYDEAAAAE